MQKHTFAKKSLGQNFLIDANVCARIVKEVNPQQGETIIEIGPGRGALTEKLIEHAGKLIAIEYDKDLIPILQENFGGREDFTLIEADALEVDFQKLIAPANKARVVANLPYYISTAILQRLIEQREHISDMTLMFQREVVERVTAREGSSERGFISVLVEAYCETKRLFDVSPESFRPVPKVRSTVARFVMREKVEIENEELFRQIVSAGFAQKRKTIFNNLRNAPKDLFEYFERKGIENLLEDAGIEKQRRAETLTLAEWVRLAS